MYGQVIFRPIRAELLKDKELFGKQDPYVKIKTNSGEFKTHTCNNGGKRPYWNDSFNFNLTGDTNIHLSVWDKDTFSKDDFLGETNINLLGKLIQGNNSNSYNLTYKGKAAGIIYIEIQYIPQPGMGMPPGMPQAMPGYGMPPGMPGYGMPPGMPGYGMPPGMPGYGMPPGMPQQGYGMPQQGYGMQPGMPGYGMPPGMPPQGYGYPPNNGYY